ncbi:hypothetical protein V2J09_020740 [Rumex salicifolius]
MRSSKNKPSSKPSSLPFSSSDLCTFLTATLVLLPCVFVFYLLATDHHKYYTSQIPSLFNASIPSASSASNVTRLNSSMLSRSKIEDELARARLVIQQVARNSSLVSFHEYPDYVPKGPIYRNPNAFHRDGEIVQDICVQGRRATNVPQWAMQELVLVGGKGPWTTKYVPELYNNSIRALCNANTSEGFNPSKDVSFPEINLISGDVPASSLGGLPPSRRTVLAFFAGRLHGHIRSLLFDQWKNRHDDVDAAEEGGLNDAVLVYEQLPQGVSYSSMLKKSKVVEAIYADCVPVLISDGYALPFNDVLNWDSFSIKIKVEDIPKIKNILMGISMRRYLKMQGRIRQVKKHFFVNKIPKRFDVFHMIVHSIWLRRLNIRIEEPQE